MLMISKLRSPPTSAILIQTRNVGGFDYPESRYLFGKAGEPSEKMLAILTDGLEQATPTGFITVGANLPCVK